MRPWCFYSNTNQDGFILDQWPKDPEFTRNWTRFVRNSRVWIGPTKCLLLCSEHATEHCYETTEMARSCGYSPRLREDAITTIKWKKQSSFETVTPSLPSYQYMYMDNLSGESNTCCHCPAVTTRAPGKNYQLSTQISTNQMNHHPFIMGRKCYVSSSTPPRGFDRGR